MRARVTVCNCRQWWMLACLLPLLAMGGCASFPTQREATYPAAYAVGVDRATRLAVRAMQELGFQVFNQNEAAGYVHGHKIDKDIMGFAETFNLEGNFFRDAGGGLRLQAVSTAGREVAVSTYPSEAVDQFMQVFERILREEASRPLALAPPGTPPNGARRADRDAGTGRFSDAADAYRRALASGPPQASVYHGLGWNYYKLGRYLEADEAFRQALALEPDNANTLLTMGSTQMQLGRRDAAVEYWQRASALDPSGEVGNIARTNLAKAAYGAKLKGHGPVAAGRSDGRKAVIAVGDVQVKAAGATAAIGDGLREMLHTALHGSGYFIVVERMDLAGIAAEQALSRSTQARLDGGLPEGRMDVAEVMVYAAVTEFEPEAKGASWVNFMPGVPLAVSQQYNEAHMALDVRVVDVASGRVLATQRVPGLAIATQGSVSVLVSGAVGGMPVGLNAYRNTPMEVAIRDCIQKSVMYVAGNIPEVYFRHQ